MSIWGHLHAEDDATYGTIMHPRFQVYDESSPDYDGDMGVIVFVARIPRDGSEDEQGMQQVERLMALLDIVAPDGVIPSLGEVLLDIAANVPHMLAVLAEGESDVATGPITTQDGDLCLSCGHYTRPDGSCECAGWGGQS